MSRVFEAEKSRDGPSDQMSPEFREETVTLSDRTLRDCVDFARKAGTRGIDPNALSEEEFSELKRPHKESAQQKIDMEILRKVVMSAR